MPSLEIYKDLEVTYLGELQQLGLGTHTGIDTVKSRTEVERAIERIGDVIRRVEDHNHYSCIDDRFCLGNCDSSHPQLRPAQAGGTLAPTMAALYAHSDIVTLVQRSEPNILISTIGDEISRLTDVYLSSHTGVCGAATKLTASTEAVSSNVYLREATKTIMDNINDDDDFNGFTFVDEQYKKIQERSGLLLPTLEGWHPEGFTQEALQKEPGGVEDLKFNNQLPHHGHLTDVIIIFKGAGHSIPRNLIPSIGLNGGFVWNIDESLRTSKILAGHEGMTGANRALMANVAWHLATANSLIKNQHIVLVEFKS